MDRYLRDLDRAVSAGDPEAIMARDQYWERAGLGWWGEAPGATVERGKERGWYRLACGAELYCSRLADGRVVPNLPAIFELTPYGPPLAPFDHTVADSLLKAGYCWVLLDMNPAPTTSSRSLSGLMRYSERFKEAGGALVIHGGSTSVLHTLDLIGFRQLLEWRDTWHQAAERLIELAVAA